MRSNCFKYLVLMILVLALTGPATAQDDSTGWRTTLVTDATITQTSYSDSWSGGEAGSINWVSNLNGSAENQLSVKFNFKSTMRFSFGQTHTQNAETKQWAKPVKSTDLIDWENLGRFTLGGYVDPYLAVRAETQFYDGAVAAKKRFFSPIKFTESGGISRQFYKKNNESVISRLGLGVRQIMKTVIIDTTLLTTADSTYTDGGIESVTDATLILHENISYTGKLTLFKALFFSESDKVKGTEFENDWKAIDVNWENKLAAAISKVITVNLYTQVLYDKEVSRRGRFKETLAIGFVYSML